MTAISAKTKEHPESVTVEYPMPEDLAGLIEQFGEEVVANAANAQLTISLQAYIRGNIEKSQDELQGLVSSWKPGTRSPVSKKSAFEKATAALGGMSPEEKAELLRRLQEG